MRTVFSANSIAWNDRLDERALADAVAQMDRSLGVKILTGQCYGRKSRSTRVPIHKQLQCTMGRLNAGPVGDRATPKPRVPGRRRGKVGKSGSTDQEWGTRGTVGSQSGGTAVAAPGPGWQGGAGSPMHGIGHRISPTGSAENTMSRPSKTGAVEVRVIAENRKARHEYDILEQVEAGLVLVGSEVKSLRGGKGNIAEAFVKFVNGEAFLIDAHIPHYAQAHQFNHEPRRARKLLMKHAELEKLFEKVQQKGLTIVPLRLFFKGAWVKVDLGVSRGRKLHDKRQVLKEKQDRREMDRALRHH